MRRIILMLSVYCFINSTVKAQSGGTFKPNIIIIYADDLGYGDLSSYGGEIPTPNIDRIGKSGIRFTDFYVSAPVCTPSRYSLLTGRYPQRSYHQLTYALPPDDKDNYLDTAETTIATYLKMRQYRTALIGKWHLGKRDMPTSHGFDEFSGFRGGCVDYFTHSYASLEKDWYKNDQPIQEKGYATDLITRNALSFISSNKTRQQPFFLMLSYNAPHYGKTDPDNVTEYTLPLNKTRYANLDMMNTLQVPRKYLDRFKQIKDPFRQTYAAMVSCLDDNIGELLQQLEKQQLLENTLIWFISDNGGYSRSYHGHASNGALKGEKGTLWEGGIRVPSLVMWKGKIKQGQVQHSLVSNLDILPTIARLTGFNSMLNHDVTDGIDAGKILFQQQSPERDLFWKYGNQTAFRRNDWKLINNKELYLLSNDIGEMQNVAGQYPEKVKELQNAFKEVDMRLK